MRFLSGIKLFTVLIVLLSFVLAGGSPASAHEDKDGSTIYWPHFSFPPLYIVGKSGPPSGLGIDVQDMLIKRLPEYQHEKYPAAISRMMQDVIDGRPVVVVGPVKTAKREAVMAYSIPMRVAFYPHIIIRVRDHKSLGGGEELSLRSMLENPALTLGRMRGASHGAVNEAILAEFPDHERTEYLFGSDGLERLIRMLDIGRVDFLLTDPLVFGRKAKELGYGDRFMALPVLESDVDYDAGHVVVPKNEWGRHLVGRINAVLREEIRSGRMLDIQSQYIPDSFMETFFKAYAKSVAGPALKDVE